MEIVKVLEVS